jgi:hypothetical protein
MIYETTTGGSIETNRIWLVIYRHPSLKNFLINYLKKTKSLMTGRYSILPFLIGSVAKQAADVGSEVDIRFNKALLSSEIMTEDSFT